MESALDIASWILLVIGGLIGVVAGVGVLRLPDVFTRMHASSTLDSLGAFCILTGLALQSGLTLGTVKIVLVFGFLLLTTATAAHALAKAALRDGAEPVKASSAPVPAAPAASAGESGEGGLG